MIALVQDESMKFTLIAKGSLFESKPKIGIHPVDSSMILGILPHITNYIFAFPISI